MNSETLQRAGKNVASSAPVLSLREAAAYLQVSKAHLSNVINNKVAGVGPMRTFRLGRRILIKREWIDDWLEGTQRKASGGC